MFRSSNGKYRRPASKTKSQFLANISHEIRTPLSAILGFSEMLAASIDKDKERSEYVQAIWRNSELLKQLIDDVLDLSKIEAGRLVVEKCQVDFPMLMKEIRQTFWPIARAKNLDLLFRDSTVMPRFIHTDPVRLKQILINIIGNSIKFTSRGHVVVDSFMSRESSSSGTDKKMLIFSVIDTGCGIAEHSQEALFEPFVQADASTTRLYGGTGLGLSIFKHLAQSLGGDVALASSVCGSGSVFRITIDPEEVIYTTTDVSSQATNGSTMQAVSARLAKLRILVVDDVPDNLLLMKRILGFAGAEAVCVDSGEKSVALTKREAFDAILMDIQMPGLDGHSTTKRLRAEGVTTPVIAVTAHNLEEYRIGSFQAGCNDHLTKPVDYINLIETIQFHINSKNREVVSDNGAGTPYASRKGASDEFGSCRANRHHDQPS